MPPEVFERSRRFSKRSFSRSSRTKGVPATVQLVFDPGAGADLFLVQHAVLLLHVAFGVEQGAVAVGLAQRFAAAAEARVVGVAGGDVHAKADLARPGILELLDALLQGDDFLPLRRRQLVELPDGGEAGPRDLDVSERGLREMLGAAVRIVDEAALELVVVRGADGHRGIGRDADDVGGRNGQLAGKAGDEDVALR